MPGRRLVVFCLIAPEFAGALEAVSRHYAAADPRVMALEERRAVQRRRADASGPPGPDRRGGTDRRRFVVPRRLAPLPPELGVPGGAVRWLQPMLPVGTATEDLTTEAVVEAVRRGNPEAPTELYWRCYERMHSRLSVLLGNAADADAAVVAAFGRLLDALDTPADDAEAFEDVLYAQTDAEALARRPAAGALEVADIVPAEAERLLELAELAGLERSDAWRDAVAFRDWVRAYPGLTPRPGGGAFPGSGRSTAG